MTGNPDTRFWRQAFRDVARCVAPQHGVDPLLAEAIAAREDPTFNPASMRFEQEFYERHIVPLPDDEIDRRNPACPRRVSRETERVAEAISWGPMHVLGATARELGFDAPFLSEIVTSTWVAIELGCRRLRDMIEAAQTRGWTGHQMLPRAVLAYVAGPGSLRWQSIPENLLLSYVSPVIDEFERLKHDRDQKMVQQ